MEPLGVVLGGLLEVLAAVVAGVSEVVVVLEELEVSKEDLEVLSLLLAGLFETDSAVGELALGTARVTIFTPSPSLLLAGINNVVCPSLRFSDVRGCW
jgi:hypothetical protein